MSQEENAVFSFELNESLYFEQGQEVAEILGISLDPEISIQPFNDYISIRGVIELNGEYQRVGESEVRGDNSFDLEDYSSRRYVEQVVEEERGEATFSHRFPVEISVPTYRVNDMNEVTVSVDYFDYEIPDQNQLRLTSIIAIQGINEIAEPTDEEEVVEQEEVAPMETEDTFRFDIKNQNEEDDSEKEQVNYQQALNREAYVPPVDDELDDNDNDELVDEEPERAPTSSVKSTEDNKYEDDGEDKIDYLSNIFRQDEERYSKMKLCIVQDNDTIETIAERYHVNPLQITKQNKLDDETVSEGQLLYIPVKQ
ncbi:LysM peptidoglycan-binding domain-containing protein [Virgibacillus necropolis]|uniref:LysM peptidoglycan-binding domain-containing protein n=1 Tax=Virgibacillus necropolis TaxID=163877 RepID=UPI00384B2694